ncbi:hypothetical protein LJB91_01975 [Bacteroidales bacterium OttesenSCG-928-L03]|nr:hypothetical protein [Bacteroidales bacterium OttesenSCG-928-L03]
MKRTNVICLLGLLLLCSCGGMRVTTSALKTYPALSEDEPIPVYFQKEDVPVDSESLGVTGALDSGMTATNKCDSITAVEHLKTEARKIGGNAVLVTEYRKPSIWGSSCHQMVATVLRVHDFSSVNEDKEEYSEEADYGGLQTEESKKSSS